MDLGLAESREMSDSWEVRLGLEAGMRVTSGS